MTPGAVEAHQWGVADEIGEAFGDIHQRARVRHRPRLDAGTDHNRLVGEQHHRQPGIMDPAGDRTGCPAVTDHANQPGDVAAELGDQ